MLWSGPWPHTVLLRIVCSLLAPPPAETETAQQAAATEEEEDEEEYHNQSNLPVFQAIIIVVTINTAFYCGKENHH